MKTKLLLFALMVSALTSLSWAAAPAVPTAIVITPGNNSLSVAFTAPAVPSPVISTYEYSTDGGASWRTRTTGTTASPISIITISGTENTALVNGTSYSVRIRAYNNTAGAATTTIVAIPGSPAAPTGIVITPGNSALSVAFTTGTNNGTAITNYKYSTDGGTTFTAFSPAQTTSPIVISGLTNGTSYNVQIKAINTYDGVATASTASTPLWGDGTAGSPYKISTGVQYSAFRAAITAANASGWPYVELSNDVSLAGITNFNLAISGFKGVFDGKGFKFTNAAVGNSVTPFNTNSISIFGSILGATIKNLEVNVAFYISKTSGGAYCTASGLVGNADLTCTIQNCKVTGTVHLTNTGAVTGYGAVRVGGIVGNCSATAVVTIINCSTNLDLKATSTTTNSNPLHYGTPYCGGIIGGIGIGPKVYIINSSAAGSVYALSNNNAPYVGGIAAQGGDATNNFQIINCLATNTVEGCNNSTSATTGCFVGGIVGNLTQNNAAAIVNNNIALNPILKSITYFTTVPTLNRISPKTTNAVFTDNYAKSDMTLTAKYSSTDGSNGTAVTITPANVTTDGNGGDLGVDPTTEATSKLNTYVSANSTFGGVNLKSWYLPSGSNPNLASFTSNPAANVSVASGELKIEENTTLLSLTVAPGAKVTVNGTNTLTATNGITLQSSSTATATLVDNYTDPTITATVQQYLPQGRNWYVASPIETNIANTGNLTGAGANSVSYYSEQYGWQHGYTGNLAEGVGYIAVSATGSNTTNISFTGKLNSGDVPITLTKKGSSFIGYNLIANPYPSYINPMAAINANTNLDGTIWYRTRKTVAPYEYKFETVNTSSGVGTNAAGTGMVTGYIPPMQAFWVKTNADNQPFTFTNSMRDHARNVTVGAGTVPTTPLKAKKQESISLARLVVAGNAGSDEAVLYFDANASNAFDKYDSRKMFESANATTPEIYTLVGNEKLVINGFNTIPYDVEIPLGFIAKQTGDYSISKSEMINFDAGTRILLKDKLQPTAEIELGEGISYNFSSQTTATTDRFSLLFRAPGATTGIDNTTKLNAQVFVNAANQITIVAPENSNYAIYNSVGQIMENGAITSNSQTSNFKLATGVYVVKVNNQTTRVVIK